MVRRNYQSKEEYDKRERKLKRHEDVKGLAKKFFGSWRVEDSVNENALVLKSFFNVSPCADIGVIDAEEDSMIIFKKRYQKKAEGFAEAYQEMFMDKRGEFIITYKFPSPTPNQR